jgi:hypothetical protein
LREAFDVGAFLGRHSKDKRWPAVLIELFIGQTLTACAKSREPAG